MMSPKALLLCLCIIVACCLLGWQSRVMVQTPPSGVSHDGARHYAPPTARATRGTQSPASRPISAEEPGALPNERIVTFPSKAALEEFLDQLGGSSGVELLHRSYYGNSASVRFGSASDLSSLLPPEAEEYPNFPVTPPYLERGALSPTATGFHGRMKEWMGIPEDNAQWGEGVKVAVIDTGIQDHPVFADGIQAFTLVEQANGQDIHPHGTAMTSLWRDTDGRIPAIAPASDLISIQVADESGRSNTFLLADAIYLATEQGADLVTISMSSPSTNPYLSEAIQHAKENGTLIIASAGNDGAEHQAYPAAHPDVLAVGAIDYHYNYPGFSNTGEHLDFVAPGVGVTAAGGDETYGGSTGTSPAAQIGGATIAAVMSELGYSDPYEASEFYLDHLNELGLPGRDTVYGEGFAQMDALLHHDQAGRYDGAIAGTLLEMQAPSQAQVQVVVDNPGAEPLSGATIHMTVQGQSYQAPLPHLSPGESHLFTLPVTLSLGANDISVKSRIELGNGLQDARPRDNARGATFSLSE